MAAVVFFAGGGRRFCGKAAGKVVPNPAGFGTASGKNNLKII
jgi:hypothetical protein